MTEINKPELPEQENLAVAIKLAQDKLCQLSPLEIAKTSGAIFIEEKNIIRLKYFNEELDIDAADYSMKYTDNRDVMEWEQVLVLHYLLSPVSEKPSGDLKAFLEIPDGHFYNDTFQRRAKIPLVETFGSDPQRLLKVGNNLGGKQVQYGDVAVEIHAFPNVPLTVLIWEGDDEFPPDGNVLFRDDIDKRMAIEDIVVVANILAIKLKIANAKLGG